MVEDEVCQLHYISDKKMADLRNGIGHSYMSGSVRILRFGESGTFKTMRENF